MRLFIGVPLPAPANDAVTRILTDLRGREWPVRWVGESGLHITLKFYGEVTSYRAEAIAEVLGRAGRNTGPIQLALGQGGAFPTVRRARIIRLEIRSDPRLELLQDRLERGSEEIGYPPEGRPFVPHVTLGRVREGQRLPRNAGSILEGIHPDLPFLADRVVLFESQQTAKGPQYLERAVQQLGVGAPA